MVYCVRILADAKEVLVLPFIHTRVNRPVSQEQEKKLAQLLGRAVSALGKSENWLMLQFDDNCRLYFKGDCQKPLAFVNVKLYGGAGRDAYQAMTGQVTEILKEVLSIPAENIYVEYEETDHWGWQGSNF